MIGWVITAGVIAALAIGLVAWWSLEACLRRMRRNSHERSGRVTRE